MIFFKTTIFFKKKPKKIYKIKIYIAKTEIKKNEKKIVKNDDSKIVEKRKSEKIKSRVVENENEKKSKKKQKKDDEKLSGEKETRSHGATAAPSEKKTTNTTTSGTHTTLEVLRGSASEANGKRRSGLFTVDYAELVDQEGDVHVASKTSSPSTPTRSALATDASLDVAGAAAGTATVAASATAAAAAGGGSAEEFDSSLGTPSKVVRFDKTVDVLVEARKLKKEAKMERKTKGLTPEKKAEKLKPIAQRLPTRIGTKITKDHKNYELMFDMLLGIRVSVSLTCGRGPSAARLPTAAFVAMRDYAFPSDGSTTTPAHKMRDFKFRDYAPKVCIAFVSSYFSSPSITYQRCMYVFACVCLCVVGVSSLATLVWR